MDKGEREKEENRSGKNNGVLKKKRVYEFWYWEVRGYERGMQILVLRRPPSCFYLLIFDIWWNYIFTHWFKFLLLASKKNKSLFITEDKMINLKVIAANFYINKIFNYSNNQYRENMLYCYMKKYFKLYFYINNYYKITNEISMNGIHGKNTTRKNWKFYHENSVRK